jgi:hypothetical protein
MLLHDLQGALIKRLLKMYLPEDDAEAPKHVGEFVI